MGLFFWMHSRVPVPSETQVRIMVEGIAAKATVTSMVEHSVDDNRWEIGVRLVNSETGAVVDRIVQAPGTIGFLGVRRRSALDKMSVGGVVDVHYFPEDDSATVIDSIVLVRQTKYE